MQTVFVEAVQSNEPGTFSNWGKFAVMRWSPEEWARISTVSQRPMLSDRGWGPEHIWVLDLQTGEGAVFRHPGKHGVASVRTDLEKHKIWVCPLYQPFLTWLYTQDITDLDQLPRMVELPDAEFAIYGYRRPGPEGD